MYKIEMHLHTSHSGPCGKVDADTIACAVLPSLTGTMYPC